MAFVGESRRLWGSKMKSRERETMRDMVREAQLESVVEPDSESNTVQIELAPLAEQMSRAGKEGRSPFLVIFDGINMGRQIPLITEPMLLGRDDSCDIVIKDAGISRRHARLHIIERGRIEVFDLKSTNGTYINGKRVSYGILRTGDKILFGQRTLAKYVMEDPLDRLYQEELWASCTKDGLTGISNRAYFKRRLNSTRAFALRHLLPYSVILFRVANLGSINLSYGMQAGDQAVVQLVQTISDRIRAEDVFSRFEGNRLAVLAVGLDHDGVRAMCERIVAESKRRALVIPGDIEVGMPLHVTVGAVTVFPPSRVDSKSVLSTAEQNLESADAGDGRAIIAARIEPS